VFVEKLFWACAPFADRNNPFQYFAQTPAFPSQHISKHKARAIQMAETSEDAVEILFEGTKYFGNTKTLFHIALVEHTSHNIIEVVSYDKRHSVEAPSLYLIYSALLLRIDGDAVSERILELREEAEECEMVVDESKIVKIAVGEALFDFLAMRLTASATAPNRAKLEFKMMRKDSVSMSAPNPVCNKPETLQPFTYASTLIRYDHKNALSPPHCA
jgi:hypothetical protein